MQPTITRAPVPLVLLTLLAMLASCVERKEEIVVAPDGSLDVTVTHRSDSMTDLLEGDGVPDAADGWEVNLRENVDEQGKMTYSYEARRFTPAAIAPPSVYGEPKGPFAAQSLQFPTTVTVEHKRGATWYHFRRVYLPRRWAELKDLAESGPAKRLQEIGGGMADGAGELSAETLDEIARALVDVQVGRTLLLGRRAFVQSAQRAGQDGWLRTKDAMERLSKEIDARATVEQFALARGMQNEVKRTEAFQKALHGIESAVDDRLQRAVREECDFGASELGAFLRALEVQRKEAEVTEDLADDHFEISVTLPGELMGTNGTWASTPGQATASWSFKGEMLFDRPIELLASSRVAD